MKRTIALFSASVLTAAFAAEVSFPLDSGDISLEGNWNGVFPGTSDCAVLQHAGPYEISRNVEFGSIVSLSGSLRIKAGENVWITANNSSGKEGVVIKANKIENAMIEGGVYYMRNNANFMPVYGRHLGVAESGATATLNAVTVTNAYEFSATKRISDAVVTVAGNSRIYARFGKVSHRDQNAGSRNTLRIEGASRLHVIDHFYFESKKDGVDGTGMGGSVFEVAGRDTLVDIGQSLIMGQYGASGRVDVADCATLQVGSSFLIGGADTQNSGLGGHAAVFSNSATGLLNTVYLGMRPGGGDNVFTVASNSFVSVATMTIGNQASGNTLVVDDAMLDVRSQLHIGSSKNTEGTDNTVILRGRNPQLCNRNGSTQWIYAFNRSKFRFEVPEGGFADIPIKGSHFHWGGDVTFEVECKKFRNAGGGTIVLAESGGSAWVDQDSGSSQSNLAERFVELNKIQPEGCYFEIKDKQILYHASYLPPVRMRVLIR